MNKFIRFVFSAIQYFAELPRILFLVLAMVILAVIRFILSGHVSQPSTLFGTFKFLFQAKYYLAYFLTDLALGFTGLICAGCLVLIGANFVRDERSKVLWISTFVVAIIVAIISFVVLGYFLLLLIVLLIIMAIVIFIFR